MSVTAKQIVAKMLEDHAGEYEERPGGPKDIWRQGGFKKFSFKGTKFTGKRPGEATKPEPDEAEDEDEGEEKKSPPKSRFSWSPPKTESLLHELGGHYCGHCKKPCAGEWDEKDKKLKCSHCGGDLQYPKSASLRSKDYNTRGD